MAWAVCLAILIVLIDCTAAVSPNITHIDNDPTRCPATSTEYSDMLSNTIDDFDIWPGHYNVEQVDEQATIWNSNHGAGVGLYYNIPGGAAREPASYQAQVHPQHDTREHTWQPYVHDHTPNSDQTGRWSTFQHFQESDMHRGVMDECYSDQFGRSIPMVRQIRTRACVRIMLTAHRFRTTMMLVGMEIENMNLTMKTRLSGKQIPTTTVQSRCFHTWQVRTMKRTSLTNEAINLETLRWDTQS
jgi:hypothetical protein